MDEIKNKAEGYASRVYDEAHLDDMRLYYMLVDAYIEGVKYVWKSCYLDKGNTKTRKEYLMNIVNFLLEKN